MCISPKINLSVKQPARLKVSSVIDPQYQLILNNSNDNVERLQAQRQQAFLDQEPEFDTTIAIEQFGYPRHLLEFKRALAQLAGNQTLKVSSRSVILIDDLAASCRVLNLPVKTRQFRRFHYLYATPAVSATASVHSITKPTGRETVQTFATDKLSA